MSIEYTLKSLISLPIRLLISGVEAKKIQLLIIDPDDEIEAIDNRIKVIQCYEKSIKRIEIPRYKEFAEIVTKCENHRVVIHEIAGNKVIQIKVRCKKQYASLLERTDSGYNKEYTWSMPTDNDYIYAALTVDVTQLINVLETVCKNEFELLYIHDF